jgi:hypothetical protein
MKRSTLLKSVASALSVGALAAICLSGSPAAAQYVVPPAEVIATLTPVYHEGHATYWYNGYWHYRDHGAWTYYHTEPQFLHDHRFAHPAEYHHYYRR